MNGIVLMIPLFLIRFGLLGLINKEAMRRGAFFPPLIGVERRAYWFYQISNILIIIYPAFLKMKISSPWFVIGLAVYIVGIVLLILSMVNFAKPSETGINLEGLYKISRNPMYMGYFFYYLGCVLLTQSKILFLILAVFQISAHWIILSEERWCEKEFGEEYTDYKQKVRRYL